MSPRLLILLLTFTTITSCHFKNKQADLILHNAIIYTVDDAFNTYEAIAIKDGKILALGTEREILNEYDAPQIIDCGKKFIYPGFIDGHCHFLGYGRTLQARVDYWSRVGSKRLGRPILSFPGNS
jgi:predicted amidohydrolase YtcJ